MGIISLAALKRLRECAKTEQLETVATPVLGCCHRWRWCEPTTLIRLLLSPSLTWMSACSNLSSSHSLSLNSLASCAVIAIMPRCPPSPPTAVEMQLRFRNCKLRWDKKGKRALVPADVLVQLSSLSEDPPPPRQCHTGLLFWILPIAPLQSYHSISSDLSHL